MDTILVNQLERVEKALKTMADSITAYNPSIQAVYDLVSAEDELSHGLHQLARHKANYARIQALRLEADALEEQLKSSVEKLAALRHELFDTPTTTFPSDSRAVPFDELLQYANNISKYTVPPTYRERVPEKEDTGGLSGAATNGISTPANQPEAIESSKGEAEAEKLSGTALEITAEEEEWLKKLKDSQIAWHPWPSNDKIRQGNLFKLMYYREKNRNLDDFDIQKFEEEERRKHGHEAEEAVELRKEVQPEVVQQPVRVNRPPRPNQEKFTLFDDMDDE